MGLRQGGDQSLLSQVFALCDHVEMLELELRLQNQHISQIQRPEPIIVSNNPWCIVWIRVQILLSFLHLTRIYWQIRANREDYGPPSPINCVDELEDEVEFGWVLTDVLTEICYSIFEIYLRVRLGENSIRPHN